MIAKIKISDFNNLHTDKGIFMVYESPEFVELYFTNQTPVVFMTLIRKDRNKRYLYFLSRFKYIKLKSTLI